MIKRVLYVGVIVFFLASMLVLFFVRTRTDSSNGENIGSKSHSAEIKNNEDFVLSTVEIKNDSETSKVLDPEIRPFWSLAELLEQNSPGQRRQILIRQYFFDSNESIEDLLEEGKNLLSEKEFLHAITGLECRIALCDKIEFDRIFNSIEQQELTKDHGSVLMYGLSHRLSPSLAAATMGVVAPIGFGQKLSKTEFDDLAFHFENLFKAISEEDKHKAAEVFFQGASPGNSRASIEFLFNNRDFFAYTSVQVRTCCLI